MGKQYISMLEASKLCSYDQGYLGLMARRGWIKADKVGKKWFTTVDWLNDYIKNNKPNEIITDRIIMNEMGEIRGEEIVGEWDKKNKEQYSRENKNQEKSKPIFKNNAFVLIYVTLIIAAAVFFTYRFVSRKVENIERNNGLQIITDEITKVPNENGSYDVYGTGKVKIGEEKIINNKLVK
jgi:hypothetical protein